MERLAHKFVSSLPGLIVRGAVEVHKRPPVAIGLYAAALAGVLASPLGGVRCPLLSASQASYVTGRGPASAKVGAASLAALPFLAPPIVLQWEGVPYLLAGLAGAALRLVAGNRLTWGLLPACVITGAVLYTLGFLVFVYRAWSAETVVVASMLPALTFAYLIVPAGIGAVLAGRASERA